MKEIKIGNRVYGVRASTLALLFYKQEFHSDMLKDLIKFSAGLKEDETNFESLTLLQFVWAMNKAHILRSNFQGFESWLEEMETFDFTDKESISELMTEMTAGFFPSKMDEASKKKTMKKT